MITILTMLEAGYQSSFEHLSFRQLKGAFGCSLISIPHDYDTLQEGLDVAIGTKIFMAPPGRIEGSTEFADFVLPGGDVVFVLGSPQQPLNTFVGDDTVLHITTPSAVDIMAVCVAGIILNEHRP